MATLNSVQLPFRPSIFNCVDWSEDADLAISGGDSVMILIPKYNSAKQWDHIRFHTDIFTAEDHAIEPLPDLDDFSISEESLNNSVVALSWSPQGLAKHQRCVLGVLTSNHVLSIYASEGNPRDVASWKRVMVINKEMLHYWEYIESRESESNPGRARARTRIQSFAWCQSLDAASEHHGGGEILLAVANGNHEISIVCIRSAYDSPDQVVLPKPRLPFEG
jgi:hypothetical protein